MTGSVYAFFGINPSTADAHTDDCRCRVWRRVADLGHDPFDPGGAVMNKAQMVLTVLRQRGACTSPELQQITGITTGWMHHLLTSLACDDKIRVCRWTRSRSNHVPVWDLTKRVQASPPKPLSTIEKIERLLIKYEDGLTSREITDMLGTRCGVCESLRKMNHAYIDRYAPVRGYGPRMQAVWCYCAEPTEDCPRPERVTGERK